MHLNVRLPPSTFPAPGPAKRIIVCVFVCNLLSTYFIHVTCI